MATSGLRAGAISCTLLSTTSLTAPALAQPVHLDVPPVVQAVDENGVDQITGDPVIQATSISIGPGGPGSLTYNWASSNSGQTDLFGFVNPNSPTTGKYSVTIGGATETFTLTGALGSGTFTQDQGRSSTLSYSTATGQYTYRRTDGAVAIFSTTLIAGRPASPRPYILSLTYPSGESLTYYYKEIPPSPTFNFTYYQVRSIVTNLGYQLHYSYQAMPDGVYRLSGVVLFNKAVETCDPNAETCNLTGNWPRLTFTLNATNDVTATDNLNRSHRWVYTTSPERTTVTSAAGTVRTWNYNGNGRVLSFSDGRGTWQYQYPNPSGGTTLTFYPEQNGPPRQVIWNTSTGLITREVVNNVQTDFTYDSNGRMTIVKVQNGPETRYTYNARGNVTQVRRISSTPGTPADIITSASYPSTCTNPVTCNQPTFTIDARGNRTDFAYNTTHGGVTSVTLPAGASGVRPQVRYGYTQLAANYRNSAGTIIAGTPIYRLTSTSQCTTLASCSTAGTLADEVRTTITYGPNDALLPVSTTSGSGDGALAATRTMTYTSAGDIRTLDGPLAGTGDTVRYYYDAARQQTGLIGPDPDGAGALLRRAVRTTYDGDGRPTNVELGTATSQADTGMSTFAMLQRQQTTYDAQGRVSTVRLISGSTTHSVIQYSTTSSGLPECTAIRMNPAIYGSLPASACTQGAAGSFGPDHIARITYDSYRRLPTVVATGVGSTVETNELTQTHTATNQVATVTDANGNRTTYEYDGHGRLVRTRFPHPQTAGTSSTTDDEILTLDANGNVTNFHNRRAQNIAFTYDALNRVTLKNLPGTEPDVSFSYDLLNRMTGASQSGNALTFTYDALGRNLTQEGPLGTVSYQYDAAGRRTRLTYPGTGLFVDYDYLLTGEVTRIRENGATTGVGVLGTYAYDNLGRRTSLTRGNGSVTSYSYDGASRLSQLVQNLTGTAQDLTLGFTYNPASQIATNTRSNDAYAWTAHFAVNRNYTVNGLNQYTLSGSIMPTYDLSGNLTSAGATTYAYSSENRLLSATGATLSYDPTGRLYQTVGGGVTTRMAYDGQSLIAEYNQSSQLQRRYVHGPSIDEPLVWYQGAGTTDRRWFHADERGSVVAISNASGAATTINPYDEFGIPQGSNAGRFQYTGQQWLPELGMYHYRARIYSPTLGRFLQTDPIGYGDGMNLYAYVGNDPLNFTDPAGLARYCWNVSVQGPYSGRPSRVASNGDIVVTGSPLQYQEVCAEIDEGPISPLDHSRGAQGAPGFQLAAAPQDYTGCTLGNGPTVGGPNRFYPRGRVNSGRPGDWSTALSELDEIAEANGLHPLGSLFAASPALAQTVFTSPTPVGRGWSGSTNPRTNYTTFSHYMGLAFRFNPRNGEIRVEVPAGFILPDGRVYAGPGPEVCHYPRG